MAEYQLTAGTTVVRASDGAIIPADSANSDRVAYIAWLSAGGVPDPALPVTPSVISARISCSARLVVADGEVEGVDVAAGFGAAMLVDTGLFWIFFSAPQPDDQYLIFTQPRGPGLSADVTDANTDYVEITVSNREGEVVTPDVLSLSIQRAQ